MLGEVKQALDLLSQRAVTTPPTAKSTAVKYGDPPEIGIALYQASSEIFLGLTETAERRIEAVLEETEALGDPLILSFAGCFQAISGVYRRLPDMVLRFGERALELAQSNDIISWEAHARVTTGWARALLGDTQSGIKEIRSGIRAWEVMGAQVMLPVWSTLLAEALLWAGDQPGALSEIEACLARWGNADEAFYRAESWRVRGDIAAAAGLTGHSEAETSYREAAQIAQRQGAALLECRANLHLAQLFVSQALNPEATEILKSTLGLLKEGVNDPDFRECSSLLRRLLELPAN